MSVPSQEPLDILIQRITNPLSDSYDPALVYAFCERVKQQQDGPVTATRLLAYRVQSPQEKEAMLALDLLDTCARSGGASFQAEVGKFRFLNELIKLLSPRYLGQRTSARVKQRVADLLRDWAARLPHVGKVKEAYQLLEKQGLLPPPGITGRMTGGAAQRARVELVGRGQDVDGIASDPNRTPTPPPAGRLPNPIFDDSQKAALLKRLLQSTDPEDIQAANRLIKTMVKQDEERVERVSRRVTELETVRTNLRLLEEMMDNYSPASTSQDELELMQELRTSCEQMRPKLDSLAAETEDREQALVDLVAASEDISRVLLRHDGLLTSAAVKPLTLLQLESPTEQSRPPAPPSSQHMLDLQLASLGLSDPELAAAGGDEPDLLSATSTSASAVAAAGGVGAGLTDLLGPLSPLAQAAPPQTRPQMAVPSPRAPVRSAFDDLGDLVRQSMSVSIAPSRSAPTPMSPQMPSRPRSTPPATSTNQRSAPAVSTNQHPAPAVSTNQQHPAPVASFPATLETASSPQLSACLLDEPMTHRATPAPANGGATNGAEPGMLDLGAGRGAGLNGRPPMGDPLLDDVSLLSALNGAASQDSLLADLRPDEEQARSAAVPGPDAGGEPAAAAAKPPTLSDVCVSLEEIKPGDHSPVPLFSEPGSLEITLHPAGNRPRNDVTVYVITALNRTGRPVGQYTLQAVCDKGARVRLQPPSATELPAGSPFLPPPAVSQVMLLANPSQLATTLRFMLSYNVDGDTVTEMAEVTDPCRS